MGEQIEGREDKPRPALQSQNPLLFENMQHLEDKVEELDEWLSESEDFVEEGELDPWRQCLSSAPESLAEAQAVAAWRDFNGFREDADFAFAVTSREEALAAGCLAGVIVSWPLSRACSSLPPSF